VPVPSQESKQSCISVLGASILSLFLRFFYWNCSVSVVFLFLHFNYKFYKVLFYKKKKIYNENIIWLKLWVCNQRHFNNISLTSWWLQETGNPSQKTIDFSEVLYCNQYLSLPEFWSLLHVYLIQQHVILFVVMHIRSVVVFTSW
jgi:hypothetical protein